LKTANINPNTITKMMEEKRRRKRRRY